MEAKCANCKCWLKTTDLKINENADWGECRRFPPTLSQHVGPGIEVGKWISTSGGDYCWEHDSVEEK